MTLPKEGAGRRRVGRGLTIGTEKKVQREEAYLFEEGRDGKREFGNKGGIPSLLNAYG